MTHTGGWLRLLRAISSESTITISIGCSLGLERKSASSLLPSGFIQLSCMLRGKSLVSNFDQSDYHNAQPLALDVVL